MTRNYICTLEIITTNQIFQERFFLPVLQCPLFQECCHKHLHFRIYSHMHYFQVGTEYLLQKKEKNVIIDDHMSPIFLKNRLPLTISS